MKKRARKKQNRESKSTERVPTTAEEEGASRLVRWAGIGTLFVLVVAFAMITLVYPRTPGPGPGAAFEVDVHAKDAAELAEVLHRAGLVDNVRLFTWYVRLTGGIGSVVSGKHLLTSDASPREIMHRLERRGSEHAKIVIPEGWTRFDIAKRLDASHVCTTHAFLVATTNEKLLADLHISATAEGYLFPATYDLELDSDPEDVVRQMVHLFDKRYDALAEKHDAGLKELSDTLGWGRREIVILASMIEKEAVMDDERAVIASVFLNRLRDPSFMPKRLQCDPTAGYGCLVGDAPSCIGYSGKITHDMNVDPENAYSTYVHDGLPPGPIGNPGAKSIEAVMSPALTHYFFFVAKGGGRHTFSETLGNHNAAVHGDAGAP
jgi:UPF0755 protein